MEETNIRLRDWAFLYCHRYTDKPSNDQHQAYLLKRYELFYLISGNVLYQVEGQTYRLHPGDLLILNNREMHRPYFESEEQFERIIVFFHPDFCRHYCTPEFDLLRLFQSRKPGSFNRIPGELLSRETLLDYFLEMEEWGRGAQPQKNLVIELIFIRLLVYLHEVVAAHPHAFEAMFDYHRRMEQILSYIHDGLDRNLTMETIARDFHINKYYFAHLFKKTTGVPFKQYVIQKRLVKAAELLNLSIPPAEAARLVGYEDYSNFYKAFKKMTGVSPSRYRERSGPSPQ